jgi:flagellar biosynthesis chaperone FliJ
MSANGPLRRLLRVLELEEEQCKIALGSAVGALNRLEGMLAGAEDRARGGRQLVAASARSGELTDRLAGLEESRTASRHVQALAPRIAVAKREAADLREVFLAKRVERRQAETLLREAESRQALEADRRTQHSLDDWYLSRLHRSRPHK